MKRKSVKSSNLAAIGYDPSTFTLEVEFNYGGVYIYSDVPKVEFEALMSATSKGKYLNANIKGVYSYVKK